MLAALTYSGLSSQKEANRPTDLDPGFITLVSALIRFVRHRVASAGDNRAAAMIEASGGRLTDSVERQIERSFI
jgi:hypothetical protein